MRYRDAKTLKKGDVVYLFNSNRHLHIIMDDPKEFVFPFDLDFVGFSKKRLVFLVLDSKGKHRYVEHLELMNAMGTQETLQNAFKNECRMETIFYENKKSTSICNLVKP